MANQKLSELSDVAAAQDSDSIYLVRSGTSYKILMSAIKALCSLWELTSDVITNKNNKNVNVTGAQAWVSSSTLTDSTTISTNCDNGNVFSVTLGGNRTLANPTNLKNGATYLWIVKQDATGSRTLAFSTTFKFEGGTAPSLTTDANGVDVITGVSDGTNIYCVASLAFA